MSDFDELLKLYTDAGRRDLAPIVEDVAQHLGLEGADREYLGKWMAQAWLRGTHFGFVEATAQAVSQAEEQGVRFNFNLNILGGPEADAGG